MQGTKQGKGSSWLFASLEDSYIEERDVTQNQKGSIFSSETPET